MYKNIFMAVAMVLVGTSFAMATDTRLTSKTYVDGRIDPLYAGTAGTVVTRDNNGAPVGGRAIYDGTGTYTSSNANDLVTAGAVADLVPAQTLPSGTANTVVMYNTTGTIGGERAIYDGTGTYTSGNANDLVTAGAVADLVTVPTAGDIAEDLPTVETTKLTCANTGTCTLWAMDSQEVFGAECETDSDCGAPQSGKVCTQKKCVTANPA